jgi:hypothetical protein
MRLDTIDQVHNRLVSWLWQSMPPALFRNLREFDFRGERRWSMDNP